MTDNAATTGAGGVQTDRPCESAGRRAALVPGLFMLLIGSWLLLSNLGFDLAPVTGLWPLILIAIGAARGWDFLAGRSNSPSVAAGSSWCVLLGAFFLGFTVGPLEWRAMAALWPVFLVIGGCARLAAWIAGNMRSDGRLVFAVVELSAGAVALMFTTGLADQLNVVRVIATAWPLGLVAIGLFLVASALYRGSQARRRPAP